MPEENQTSSLLAISVTVLSVSVCSYLPVVHMRMSSRFEFITMTILCTSVGWHYSTF